MNLGASLPAKSPPPESAAGEGDGDWRGRCRSCGYRRGKQPGAIVRAFDTRPEVKEQVQSMGAEFLELDFKEEAGSGDGYAKVMSEAFIKAEMALFAARAKEVDIIVTTALIPGKPAPKLITRDMVDSMKAGSVIVDRRAEWR